MELISRERVMELLDYDLETGIFTRKTQRCNRVHVGDVAGHLHRYGYRYISLDGRYYRASRLAFLIVHGRWPTPQVDHANGIRDDDRIANLREVSNRQNCQNLVVHRAGQLCGAQLKRDTYRSKPWQATIYANGKQKNLGMFATEQEAHEAYVNHLAKIGEEPIGIAGHMH